MIRTDTVKAVIWDLKLVNSFKYHLLVSLILVHSSPYREGRETLWCSIIQYQLCYKYDHVNNVNYIEQVNEKALQNDSATILIIDHLHICHKFQFFPV